MSGVLIRGRLTHYESFGRGRPVVLVHGWLGSWRYWVPVMDVLSTDCRCYALDLWGFGDSDKGHEAYDLDSYVDLLLGFMDELGIGQAPIVGHTLGGAVAARLALEHPARVGRVMAVGLPLSASTINRKLLTAGSNDALARLFWQKQRPYAEVEMSVAKTAKNAIALTVQSVVRMDVRAALAAIDVPVLAVYGEKDGVIDAQQADELDGNHYAARAIVLSGTYHFPMLDEPAKFTRLLRDFMDVDEPQQLQDLSIKAEWRRRTR
jgi:pimeloyl-ACP methyl ester carboxylesterase